MVPLSLADLGQISHRNGVTEILFKFDPTKNEEMTHIFFGVDYEIFLNKPAPETRISIATDGTYKGQTDAAIKVNDLSGAVAVVGDESVAILDEVTEDDTMVISYCPEVDRFVVSPDLRKSTIHLYRVDCIYPRWIDYKRKRVPVDRGIKEAEVPLEWIYLVSTSVEMTNEGKRSFGRRWKGELEYWSPKKRTSCPPQPDNARRIKFQNIQLVEEILLRPHEAPTPAAS